MKMEEIPVLITGVGGPAGQGAVKYFNKKGFSVIGTDIKDVDAPVDRFYRVPPAFDQDLPTALIEIIKQEKPFLLIPTVTEELHIISRLKRVIEAYGCLVFISSPDVIDIVNDKLKTAVIMAGHGMSVPVSFDESTPKEIIVKNLNFPVIGKHRSRKELSCVTLYWNPEELFKETKHDMIFQEFIPGEEFNINMLINKNGEIWENVVLKKTIFKDGLTGDALDVGRVKRSDIEQFGARAAQILNLSGPVDMDVRLREDGTPVLLEINARVGRNILEAKEVLDSLLISATKEELATSY